MPRVWKAPRRDRCIGLPESPLDLALEYMAHFFSGNISGLRHVLAADLSFAGPFHSFHSAEAYLASLEADPPVGCSYEVLSTFETPSAVCLVYRFTKPGVSTTMAQVFEVADGKIRKIRLVFDTGAFGTRE